MGWVIYIYICLAFIPLQEKKILIFFLAILKHKMQFYKLAYFETKESE